MPHALTAVSTRTIERRLTIGYVAALSLVALLTLASHVVLDRVVRTQDGSAAVINVSGRQRMLSQRIASLAAQYTLGDRSALSGLRAATDQFEREHEALIHGDATLGLSPPHSPALRAIYFSGSTPLDAEMNRYIAEARQVAALPPDDPRAKPVLRLLFDQAAFPLLHELETVVAIHERESERQLFKLEVVQDATLVVVLLTLVLEAFGIFRPLVQRVSHYAGQLLTLATVDPLTGALNRRSFLEGGSLAVEAGHPATVLMIDADHFKRINDTYSHAGGDAVLKALVGALKQGVRREDLVGRLGGEEFAILLPGTTLPAAQQIAEQLRAAISALAIDHEGEVIRFTVSMGLASLSAGEGLHALIARADRALYAAKAQGRNRVEVAA